MASTYQMPADVVCEDEGLIRPGDVYEYRCDNDQGYGIMVPVKTSRGWDFIDTYYLNSPSMKPGETLDEASVRRIIELGHGEHDGYVSRVVSDFYNKNAIIHCEEVPSRLALLFNVSDYDIISRREARDFDDDDVAIFIPMYEGQHFDWGFRRTLGLCFVRKGAVRSLAREFNSLCNDAWQQLTMPSVGMAAEFLEKAQNKLREIEASGLASRGDEARVVEIKECIRAIEECRRGIDAARGRYYSQIEEE